MPPVDAVLIPAIFNLFAEQGCKFSFGTVPAIQVGFPGVRVDQFGLVPHPQTRPDKVPFSLLPRGAVAPLT